MTGPALELKLKLDEIEDYLQNEFPGRDLIRDDNHNGADSKDNIGIKAYYSFSIGNGIDSANVAFYRDFFYSSFPGKIKMKLQRFNVAGEMKRAGPYQTILVRNNRVEIYPTRGFLPSA